MENPIRSVSCQFKWQSQAQVVSQFEWEWLIYMVETRQLLYVGCATQQQPTSAGTRSDPSRRAGSRVARVH